MTRICKKLNEYEAQQVERIAAWKSEFPNPFGELFRAAAEPIAKAVESIIPDRVALLAIESTYRAADLAATANDIKVQAGVKELSALRQRPLELCDKLSRRVGTTAQVIAMPKEPSQAPAGYGPLCLTCRCFSAFAFALF
jgi:hypothetical protein